MSTHQPLQISIAADAQARLRLETVSGFGKMGFRFSSNGGVHTFEPLVVLKVGDYVLQPRRVVIFVDQPSYDAGYGIDIDYMDGAFTFTRSERIQPPKPVKVVIKKVRTKKPKAKVEVSAPKKVNAEKVKPASKSVAKKTLSKRAATK